MSLALNPKTNQVFFTSDTHFGHANVLKFCPDTRMNLKDIDEADERLITNWNNQVGDNDIVFHLGDVAFNPSQPIAEILKRLKGKIYLIAGNHDKKDYLKRTGRFEGIYDYLKLKLTGIDQKFILFHYPIYSWDLRHYGSIHLHGHTHGNLPRWEADGRVMDVGIDARPPKDMRLWDLPAILDVMEKLPIRPHGGAEP